MWSKMFDFKGNVFTLCHSIVQLWSWNSLIMLQCKQKSKVCRKAMTRKRQYNLKISCHETGSTPDYFFSKEELCFKVIGKSTKTINLLTAQPETVCQLLCAWPWLPVTHWRTLNTREKEKTGSVCWPGVNPMR